MSAFNGSGTFVISGTGLPYVTATTISSTVANQLNTDLATGLSTTVTKDGQTTPTANLPMGGFKHTGAANATASGQYLVYGQPQVNIFAAAAAAFGTTGTGLIGNAFTQTDSTTGAGTVATAYGSVFGALTLATAANAITVTNGYGAYFAAPVAGSHVTLTNGWALGADSALINGVLKATGHVTLEGVTSTGATGTGNLVFSIAPTITGHPTIEGVTSTGATGTAKLVFSSLPSFDTTIGVGGATANASGSGVSFPATANPSTDVNTLDDYEEGAFTLTDATGQGVTFVGSDCVYTKIGRKVFIDAYVLVSVTGSGSANIFGGLPFTSANVQAMQYKGSMPGVLNIFTSPATVTMQKNSTTFTVRSQSTESSLTWTQISNSEFAFQLNYNV